MTNNFDKNSGNQSHDKNSEMAGHSKGKQDKPGDEKMKDSKDHGSHNKQNDKAGNSNHK